MRIGARKHHKINKITKTNTHRSIKTGFENRICVSSFSKQCISPSKTYTILGRKIAKMYSKEVKILFQFSIAQNQIASLQNSTDTSNKDGHQYNSNYSQWHKRKEHNKISLKKSSHILIPKSDKNTTEKKFIDPLQSWTKMKNSQYNVFQREFKTTSRKLFIMTKLASFQWCIWLNICI